MLILALEGLCFGVVQIFFQVWRGLVCFRAEGFVCFGFEGALFVLSARGQRSFFYFRDGGALFVSGEQRFCGG